MTLGLGGFAGMFYQSIKKQLNLYVIQTILECRKEGNHPIYEASINLI